ALLKACTNGSSELMSNISMSIVGILYNIQLMEYAGENGVAAYGVLMYVGFVFNSIFIGYSIGTAPVIGFHFGAKHEDELKSLLRKSIRIILICSLSMVIIAELLAVPFSRIFVGYDESLFDLTKRGFFIYSFSFLFSGIAIFGSSFFTALNDGLTSATISFLRTLVFQIAAVLLLPLIWEIDGVWISVVAAEVMAVALTVFFLIIKRKKYRYM
ncbi:MAG: MATE family efflux transporter, partial [Ruminiclostridium sp.]|nr:MATE family efflux transporter [Ruminiclostridium sp.]